MNKPVASLTGSDKKNIGIMMVILQCYW
jgi:hypothetical protein